MISLHRILLPCVVLMLGCAFIQTANAQATRTWISGVGDDVNPCSRTAPCKTFPGAISKTATGGEINCLDPGGFGSVTITKSITLDCGGGVGGQVGSILASGAPAITINGSTGAEKVIIRNLSINGINGSVSAGTYGIRFIKGASLTIEHVGIYGFGGGNVAAVEFAPQAVGSKLFMHDVEVLNSTANGINVAPVSGVAVSASIDNVMVTGSGANGLQATDGATVTVTQSRLAGNGRGVNAKSTTGLVEVNLDEVVVANNVGQGVLSQGTSAIVRLSETGIFGNAVGVQTSGSGTIHSFSNNRIAGNTTDGAPTTSGPQQ